MKLILCDIDPGVVAAWRAQFALRSEVEIRECSLVDAPCDALVNPGNSFGFMDSGLGLQLSERFGFAFQDEVRKVIRERHAGEILVGQAEVFPTGGSPPFLVYAPISRTPQGIQDTVNVYLAARGALLAARAFNRTSGKEAIGALAFPGLGTGIGKMHPLIGARQMRYAYEEVFGLREPADQNLSRCARREKKMKEMPLAWEGKEGEE